MTLVKDGKADSIQGSLEEGLIAEERDRLNSDSSNDRWTFIAKDRAGSMDGKLLRGNIKARRPLARPSALDPSNEMVSQVWPQEEEEGRLRRKQLFLHSQVPER